MCETGWVGLVGGEGRGQEAQAALRKREGGSSRGREEGHRLGQSISLKAGRCL